MSLNDFEDAFEDATMWGGGLSLSSVSGNFVTSDGKSVVNAKLVYTPRVYQIFDELVLNVADQNINAGVDACDVRMNADGSIEVTNYGPGFNVSRHGDLDEWIPFVLSAFMNQGDKNKRNRMPNSPTGGVNGLGLKLCVRSCVWYEIHTVDAINKRYYRVRYEHKGDNWVSSRPVELRKRSTIFCRDNLPFNVIGEEVIDLASGPTVCRIGGKERVISAVKPFTTMRFLPRYAHYRMTNFSDLFRACRSRMYEIATYMSSPITINDVPVPIRGLEDYIKMTEPDARSVHIEVLDPEGLIGFERWTLERRRELFARTTPSHFPLRVGITVGKTNQTESRWACINGATITTAKCIVFTALSKQIEAHFAKKLDSSEFTTRLRGCISLYVVGSFIAPDWGGQTKAAFTLPQGFMKPYVLSEKTLDAICVSAKQIIKEQQRIEETNEVRRKIASPVKVRPDKMMMSPLSSPLVPWEKRRRVNLFMVEGDSAVNYIRWAMSAKDCCLAPEHVSRYIMTGVPMNVRREFIDVDGPQPQRLPSLRLADYNIWNEFMHMVGLKYGCRYETDREIETLLVGKIIILTDQDVDGEGNITALIVNFIDTFFPELIKRGMIWRMTTELIRVFDGKKFLRGFHNECDYHEWAMENNYYNLVTNDIFGLVPEIRQRHPELEAEVRTRLVDEDETVIERTIDAAYRKYIVNNNKETTLTYSYYKGLAKHNVEFCQRSFTREHFVRNVFRFVYDDDARKTFEDFFNEDSEPRKIELRKGMRDRVVPLNGALDCSALLRGPLVIFSLEDMRRKLSGQYDGLNDVKRRILYAALTTMKRNTVYKFDNLVGQISTAGHYHHGNATLSDVMKLCSAAYFGSRRVPFFISDGNVGTRAAPKGGAPRYLEARINHEGLEYLYPTRDIDILPHRVEDGEVSVVVYFCSTIPPLFETTRIPSHGWSIVMHAYSIESLIAVTRAAIDGTYNPHVHKLAIDTNGWKGHLELVRDDDRGICDILSVGKYTYENGWIIVSELPFLTDVVAYTHYLQALAEEQTVDESSPERSRPRAATTHPFIENWCETAITDESSGVRLDHKEIHLRFRVSAATFERLKCAKYKDIELPPALAVAYKLGLTTTLSWQRNFMDPRDRIIEFESDQEIIRQWFIMRRKLYKEHVERQLTLLTLERAYLLEMQRVIDENISDRIKNKTFDVASAVLIEGSFFKFATAIINNPTNFLTASLCMYATGFMTIEQFEDAWQRRDPVVENENLTDADTKKISHKYIYSMTMKDFLSDAYGERARRIDRITDRLAELRHPDAWKHMWLADLDGLQAMANKYLPRLWFDV